MPDLCEITTDGRLRLHFHSGQWKAWESEARVTAVLAGTQWGKTVFGPAWLYREIQRRGPGDYLVVTPTFPLLNLKALPAFLEFFNRLQLGTFTGGASKKYTFSANGSERTFGQPTNVATRIIFGHAQDPDSLESATAKACWIDEGGQKKFKLGSWEAIRRRLAIHQGRILITTTIYCLGWLKQKIWDVYKAGDKSINVITSPSITNPAFPKEEYEAAMRDLPRWKFLMYYRGEFSRPAGLIYDCFDEGIHLRPKWNVPRDWPRYLGLDFGGVHTAGIFFAEDPGNHRLYAYREYLEGSRTSEEHVRALLAGEPGVPVCVGGSKSEGQWRAEFAAAGLPVMEPEISDVEVGIDRVYGALKRNEICVAEDLDGLREEITTYSRVLDDRGEPTEKIEDKESFHRLDGARYILSWVCANRGPYEIGLPPKREQSMIVNAPRGVFVAPERDSERDPEGGDEDGDPGGLYGRFPEW